MDDWICHMARVFVLKLYFWISGRKCLLLVMSL